MNILKPRKNKTRKKSKDVRYAVVDIEAEHWKEFLCLGHYDKHNDHFKLFDSLASYAEFIYDYCFLNEIPNIFAHFGGKYDFNFLLGHFFFNKKFQVTNMIDRGSGLLCFSVACEQKKYKIGKKDKYFELVFRDSSALLPSALRSLCKSFNIPTMKGDMCFDFVGEAWRSENYVPKLFLPLRFRENDITVFYEGHKVDYYTPKMDIKKITYTKLDTGDTVFRIFNREDVIEYLKKDCVGLSQVLNVFYEWPLVKESGGQFTTAGQAVKIWQLFLDKPIFSIPLKVDAFVRRGYFGGRTEIFKPIFDSDYDEHKNILKLPNRLITNINKYKNKKLSYIDANSLYPTVMRANRYPVKFKYSCSMKEFYNPNDLGFWDVTVDVPKMFCPPLPVKYKFKDKKKGEKLIFPTGVFRGVFSIAEIEYAKTLGVKVLEYHSGDIFEDGGFIFKEFIDELYTMRIKAQHEGDSVTDNLTKLIMNSCYGRLGLNINRTKLEIDSGGLGSTPHAEIIAENGDIVRLTKKGVVLSHSFTNVAISAYVTSYARIFMHKEIYSKAGEDHLFYTDTDSAFTTLDLSTLNMGEHLGQFKLEKEKPSNKSCEYDSACFLLPKTYILDGADLKTKIVMKGLDKKKIKNFTQEDFKEALAGDYKNLSVYQGAKFATLKTALQKGKFVTLMNDPHINRELDNEKLESLSKAMEKVENAQELKSLKSRIARLKKKLSQKYDFTKKGIKSQYDKRIILDGGLLTRAIHLGENGDKL